MSDPDPFDLERFVAAQDGVFPTALRELRAGRKESHWMWFVFPQMRGLGSSPMAHAYGLASGAEARAYLAHPVLGPRLRQATEALLAAEAPSLRAILGSPDDLKFRSSMTLFAHAGDDAGLFRQAIDRWCGGQWDGRTLALLG